MTKAKTGFYPLKDMNPTDYVGYYLVPGVWVYADENKKKCWGVFTSKKEYLGCYINFLDAKEKVKNCKISKFIKK